MRVEGAPPYWACPPILWAPWESTDLLLPAIYTHVPRKHQKRPRKTISTAVTFCIRKIPSWSLRRHSAGGGINHGGPLHQHPCPSDELWVVYHRRLGDGFFSLFDSQYQVLLDLLGHLFNVTLFAVCLSRSNELWVYDQVYLWIIFESSLISFMYDWVIFSSLFELSVWFGLLDWSFLECEKCLALGSILRCPFPVTARAARHVLYCCHRG